jgi:hypothetical protein
MNKKILPLILLAIFFTLTYTACKKADKVTEIKESDAYYPLQIGKYVIYNVDSTIWDDTQCVTITRRYQMMHTVVDTFTDNKGRMSYRIDVRIRKKAEDPWQVHDIMQVTNTGQELEMAYSTLRFIKMIYPIAENRTWKGNSYIVTADTDYAYFNDWNYRYINVDQPFGNGLVTYNNTVTVMAIDQTVNDPQTQPRENAVRTYSKEVYSKGIGMVYREYYRWTYDANSKNNTDIHYINTRCLKGDGVILRAVDHN